MGPPRVNRFQDSLALEEALKADNDIEGTVEGFGLLGMRAGEVPPAAHVEADNVTVRSIPARQMIAAYITQAYSYLLHNGALLNLSELVRGRL